MSMKRRTRMPLLSRPRKCEGCALVILLMVSFLVLPLLNAFPIVKAADVWWDAGWSYRKTVTIDHTKVSGSLSDFPVLLDVTDTNLASDAQSDGDDIVFVESGGAKLNHEVELFDSATGHLVTRVKVPLLSQATDTVVYMYYGNPAAGNQQNPPGVWDSNAKMVLHLDETSGTQHDSSVNANNAVPYGGVLQGVSGRIAGADTFDGVNDYLQTPHSDTLAGFSQGFTESFWLRLDDVSRRQTILNKYNTGTSQRSWYIEYQTNMLGFFASQDGSTFGEWHGTFKPTVGKWYFITVTWEPNAVPKFYVNGTQVTTSGTAKIASIYNNAGVPLYIGRCPYDATRYLKGGLDEVCLSDSARSLSWIKTSYNDQASPSTFYSVGPQETPANDAPVISNVSPSNGATGVPVSISQLSFNLTDLQHDLIDYTVTTSPDIGSGGGTGKVDGEYSISVNDLNYDTSYSWTVTATDGQDSNSQTFTFTTQHKSSWWNTSWQYRRTITIDHTKVSSDLTNFPVLIDLTDNGLTTKVQSNGNDFAFTDANQAKLCHEIELYESSTGHLVAWVKIPLLSSTLDTVLYMYYGNPSCTDQQDTTAVWDSSSKLVLHLDEKTGIHYDATVNGNNGTPYNGVSQGASGRIDGADTFDGSNDYVQVATSNTLSGFTQGLTISFWLKLNDVSRRQMLLCKYNTGTGQRSWYVEFQNHASYGKVIGFFASQDGTAYKEWYGSLAPTAGTWYYITVVWQTNTVPKFYINGVQVTTRPGSGTLASIYNNVGIPLYIGRCPYDATRYVKGSLDEIRISNLARNTGWILSSCNSQKDPTAFYQLGTEEAQESTLGIDFSFDSASIGAYTIDGNEVNFILVTESLTTGEVYAYWTYFKVTNTLDKEVTFRITNAADAPFLSTPSREAQMVYSYNGDNWFRFTDHSYSAGIYTFTGTFTNNAVYIATFFPFSYTEMQQYTNTVDASPWATKFVLGSSEQGREISLLKITNPNIPDTNKKVIYIIGRQHSAETCSSHMLRGMIDFLISDNVDAQEVRDKFVWYIVPMVNPDGVYLGKSRGTSENRNANRDWVNNETVEINIVRNHINLINNSIGIDFFIDWHSQMDDIGWYNYVYSPPENTFFIILSAWTDFDTQFASDPGTGSASSCTARQYVSNNIIYDPMFILEPTPHPSSWTISSLEQEGMNVAYAINEYFTIEPFTIIVLPDTQFYSQSNPAIFTNQTQWIVNNADDRNTLFVLHEGDIVNNDVTAQWTNANTSMSLLDDHVPWAVLPGNHDGTNVGAPGENLNNYNKYFPYSRFSNETWYGDAYNSVNTNSYVLFSGGYDDYIIFNFQYNPSNAVLAWANTTIDAYPNRRAIIVTHSYLNTDGTRTTEGKNIWNGFVSHHADQIFLVLCGHMYGEARRQDAVNGNVVYQALADYQSRVNGGDGLLRILEFHPTQDTIYVKTFTPYHNSYETDADSQFTLNYDMTSTQPFAVSLQSPDNSTTTMDNMPDFKFIATNPNQLTFDCSLWLQNGTSSSVYAFKTGVVNGSLATLTPSSPVPNGVWRWWINCTAGTLSRVSEKRSITIDVFRGDKTFTSSLDGTTRTYWLDMPDDFDISAQTPLVFFLHGYGASRYRYSDPTTYPEMRKVFQNHTWIVAAVECRESPGDDDDWYTEPSRRDITDILTQLGNSYSIDPRHVHVMGNSMGGGGSLKYAMFNNQVVASLVDIHGITNFTRFYYESSAFRASLIAAYGGTPSQVPAVYANESALGNEQRFSHTAVMMLHGTADSTVLVSQSRYLNQSLSALGYTVKYIEVPGAGHDAPTLIKGREMEIFNWLCGHPLVSAPALTPANSTPAADYRWMDVADQTYSAEFQTSYNYSQATVHVLYNTVGEFLTGEMIAQNLKPNFAYQLKLVGTPGTADNELIGFAGRWWQEEWNGTAWNNGQNLNDKGNGTSPNPNDKTYLTRKSIADATSPTGLHYRYTSYLLFDYFLTDSNGDATFHFETGSCYHVLWKTSQRSPTADDGPLKTVTFDPIPSFAYDGDYPSSTVSIFGEWERLPRGGINLATGNYNCQIVLTEESFHGTRPLEGNWAAAMSTNISFTIAT